MSSFSRRSGDTRAWWIQEPPAAAQRQAFTQYRTPPRPPSKSKEEDEEDMAIMKDVAAYENVAAPEEEEGTPISRSGNRSRAKRIFRNRKFWMVFGLAAMLLTSVFVLVLKATFHSNRPLAGAQAQSATPLIAPPAAATGNQTSTVTAPSTTSITNRVACPASNGTVYTAADRSPFRILCDYDAGAAAGVVSEGTLATASFEECLDACAGDASCCGAGWGPKPESSTLTCWKKMRVRIGGPRDRAKGGPAMMIFGEREMLL